MARRGVVVSLGHTAADYDLFRRALDAGARHTTHLFNAMTGLHHRAPGAPGAALTDDRATVELIADGEHVHPAVLALAIRAKGPDRVALVSDAVGPAGLPPGDYDWLGRRVTSDGTTVRLPDGTLAGSLGTLDVALRTVTGASGIPLPDAALMAATVPASSAPAASPPAATPTSPRSIVPARSASPSSPARSLTMGGESAKTAVRSAARRSPRPRTPGALLAWASWRQK